MTLTGQTKTLLAIAAIMLLMFFMYNQNESSPVHNEGSVEIEAESNSIPENIEEDSLVSEDDLESEYLSEDGSGSVSGSEESSMEMEEMPKYKNIPIPRDDMIKYFPQKDYAPPESDWLKQKFNSRNKAKRGFKKASYSGALRGNLGPSDWSAHFDHNNNVISNSQTGENDKFLPIDESNGGFAVFKSKGRATCGSNQNCEPEDLFDVDKYLPQEVNDDWFEVQPEPISVKNRHLINITKPIGINTIGTSLRNASYDVRGVPSNPRFVVSPWLQSSIEPDTNLKPLL